MILFDGLGLSGKLTWPTTAKAQVAEPLLWHLDTSQTQRHTTTYDDHDHDLFGTASLDSSSGSGHGHIPWSHHLLESGQSTTSQWETIRPGPVDWPALLLESDWGGLSSSSPAGTDLFGSTTVSGRVRSGSFVPCLSWKAESGSGPIPFDSSLADHTKLFGSETAASCQLPFLSNREPRNSSKLLRGKDSFFAVTFLESPSDPQWSQARGYSSEELGSKRAKTAEETRATRPHEIGRQQQEWRESRNAQGRLSERYIQDRLGWDQFWGMVIECESPYI